MFPVPHLVVLVLISLDQNLVDQDQNLITKMIDQDPTHDPDQDLPRGLLTVVQVLTYLIMTILMHLLDRIHLLKKHLLPHLQL